jgi:hypothetical protein
LAGVGHVDPLPGQRVDHREAPSGLIPSLRNTSLTCGRPAARSPADRSVASLRPDRVAARCSDPAPHHGRRGPALSQL